MYDIDADISENIGMDVGRLTVENEAGIVCGPCYINDVIEIAKELEHESDK